MYANRPSLSVYDDQQQVATSGSGSKSVIYDSNQNTLRIFFANSAAMGDFTSNERIRVGGDFGITSELNDSSVINGREFTINNVNSGATPSDNFIEINTTGLDFPDDDFSLAETDLFVMSGESTTVEAFFEGAENVYDGATDNFNSKRVVLRETSSTGKHFYTNSNISNLDKIDSFGAVTGTPGADGTYNILASQISANSGTGVSADINVAIVNGVATATVGIIQDKVLRQVTS